MEKDEKMMPTVIGSFSGVMAAASAIANAKRALTWFIVIGSVLLVGVGVALALIIG